MIRTAKCPLTLFFYHTSDEIVVVAHVPMNRILILTASNGGDSELLVRLF